MRLIDADKLNPDRMTNKGTVAISQSQIAKAPTVQAIPIDILDKIRAEINGIEINGQVDEHTMFIRDGEHVKRMVLEIIDKYKKVRDKQ